MQRIFQLAISGYGDTQQVGGFVGQITCNSFMKREFGKKLIEEYFAGRDGTSGVDLTHVIDTAGAYIPGHGTPTVILFGRNRAPVAKTIRAVMGIRGEPSTPDDPAQGLVWSAIVAQIDQPGSQSEFVSVADSPRAPFRKHPWSIGGGGGSELKDFLDESAVAVLHDKFDSINAGICITREDDAYLVGTQTLSRARIGREFRISSVQGENVRDWSLNGVGTALFPYDAELRPIDASRGRNVHQFLWPYQELLWRRRELGGDHRELGRTWWEWNRFLSHRFRVPRSLTYAEIATHNHFVLDRGGKIFNRTAPVIKLPTEATEDDHLALLGLLNSSTACFWMKQVAHQKQMMGGDGVRIESKAKVPYAFSGTQLGKLPVPEPWEAGHIRERLLELTRMMDRVALRLSQLTPQGAIVSSLGSVQAMRDTWKRFQHERLQVHSGMIFLQEEIDFTVYEMWGLADQSVRSDKLDWPAVTLDAGDRPFDILRGRNEDDFPVPNGIPAEWPSDLRQLWQRRMDAISQSAELRLIEDPHYKRRWIGRQGLFNHTRNKDELDTACTTWLLDRLESYFDFDGRMNDEGKPTAGLDVALTSVARLADVARQDSDFMQVGELYRDDAAFDVQRLVAELVEAESVPLLPVLRYKATGLRKRAEWEKSWDLQRRQDELAAERKEATRAIRQERERVAKSLAAEKAEVNALRAALWKECLEVRDRFARGFELPQNADPEVAVRILGQHGVAIDGGNALKDLQARLERVEKKVTEFEIAVSKLCQKDAAYQAAAARYAAIPPDPNIDVPPKYTSADFLNSDHWRLRGKLDVPKERWVSFPHCEGPDGTLAIAWAGYDHLQLARAISAYYVDIQERLGGRDDPRLVPAPGLLAGTGPLA